ncbi:hypothetical protein CLV56_2388 [Mumia flava]|uniref:Sulfotransferase family protein n=1 Tax=Mumia flava TaxID=1348852 RepID=A0A2M9BJM4_9ACTN|nr:hypothetical protein [Mumia flava]PJJ58143.1 hypothetical protein CLV56_2388 [Mumia flava]
MADLLLPEGSLLLHIGPQKTGSTAIQAALHGNRERLSEYDAAYPGSRLRERRAGWAAIGGAARGRPTPRIEEWNAFVDEVSRTNAARICVSNEDFAQAPADRVPAIVEDLGGDHVHVVAVARRLDRLLPSQWQERVKARQTATYLQWLDTILRDPDSRAAHRVWNAHDLERMVGRWVDVVGPERFTLIVSDDSDRGLLAHTFEDMLGLPQGLLVGVEDESSNSSLSYTQTELVRRINEQFDERGWSDELYLQAVQSGIIWPLRNAPKAPKSDRPPPLPDWARTLVADMSEERVAVIERLGVRVVGDPSVLLVPRDQPGADEADFVPPDEVPVELAAFAVASTIERLTAARTRETTRARKKVRALRRKNRALRREVRALGRDAPDTGLRARTASVARRAKQQVASLRRRGSTR